MSSDLIYRTIVNDIFHNNLDVDMLNKNSDLVSKQDFFLPYNFFILISGYIYFILFQQNHYH